MNDLVLFKVPSGLVVEGDEHGEISGSIGGLVSVLQRRVGVSVSRTNIQCEPINVRVRGLLYIVDPIVVGIMSGIANLSDISLIAPPHSLHDPGAYHQVSKDIFGLSLGDLGRDCEHESQHVSEAHIFRMRVVVVRRAVMSVMRPNQSDLSKMIAILIC